MRKLFYIPIEEYDRRYTADWVKQFEDKFKELNINYETIKGQSVTSKITCGDVLDAYGTTLYKLSQLNQIVEKLSNNEIQDDDVIFFADGWFPGVENLAYIRNLSGINFKLACILHAGSWDNYDFTYRTGMRDWAYNLENSWFEMYDYIVNGKDILYLNPLRYGSNVNLHLTSKSIPIKTVTSPISFIVPPLRAVL